MAQAYQEEKRRLFAWFLCLSDTLRIKEFGYATQGEFADANNVTQKSLSNWKKDPRFKKMKMEFQMEIWDDRLANVVDKLYDRGVGDGDVTALKELTKIAGISKDKLEIISTQDVNNILAGVADIITKYITDESALLKISEEIAELTKEMF